MISPSLREKVSILIFSKVIQKNKKFNHVFKKKKEMLTQMLGHVDIEDIVAIMISKFETVLHDPEDQIVKQLDDDRDMYLIAKGACEISYLDERNGPAKSKNDLKSKSRTLRHSDYFGEISMVYGCKRTANVQSTKYSTLAKLSYEHYREILIEF